jgi:hypothetical protein
MIWKRRGRFFIAFSTIIAAKAAATHIFDFVFPISVRNLKLCSIGMWDISLTDY